MKSVTDRLITGEPVNADEVTDDILREVITLYAKMSHRIKTPAELTELEKYHSKIWDTWPPGILSRMIRLTTKEFNEKILNKNKPFWS